MFYALSTSTTCNYPSPKIFDTVASIVSFWAKFNVAPVVGLSVYETFGTAASVF
jgi:hypothetical protein